MEPQTNSSISREQQICGFLRRVTPKQDAPVYVGSKWEDIFGSVPTGPGAAIISASFRPGLNTGNRSAAQLQTIFWAPLLTGGMSYSRWDAGSAIQSVRRAHGEQLWSFPGGRLIGIPTSFEVDGTVHRVTGRWD